MSVDIFGSMGDACNTIIQPLRNYVANLDDLENVGFNKSGKMRFYMVLS